MRIGFMLSNKLGGSFLLHNRSLAILITCRTLTTLAFQMLAVGIGWHMYELTGSTFYLGLVGLAQFLPMLFFIFISGHAADRYNRKVIISISQSVEAITILFLALGSYYGWLTKEIMLGLCFIYGTANTFQGPSTQSLLPNVVSRDVFPRAVALSSSAFQPAVITGPMIGGFLYAFGAQAVYLTSSLLLFTSASLVPFILLNKKASVEQPKKGLKEFFAGIAFIKSRPAILGAISLDLFAVLLGGATALLPVYAKMLGISPLGLGVLRSAPAIGALVVAFYLSRRPLQKQVGRKMFTAVICFGLATIVFALSKFFVLSLFALMVLGASDVVSVVIRSTFVQMSTPDHLRGRVSSVNQLFIGTSNQLGEFESGVTASIFGSAVTAVLVGGIGTIVVALTWMKLFPTLFRLDKIKIEAD